MPSSIVDYVHRGFFAKDKASVAAIAADAVAELEKKEEPDGDEGSGAKTVNVHVHGNSADATEARFKKLEDGFSALDAKISKVLDAVSSRTKDDDGDEEKTDEEKTDDEFPPKGDDDTEKKDDDDAETKDEEEGSLTSGGPTSAEPELMEADPALKTGPTGMGDATYRARTNAAMANLIKDTKARAEILAPGLRIGILDGALGTDRMKQAGTRICDTRRGALLKAVTTPDGQMAVGRYTGDSIKTMSCDAVRMLFLTASDNMRGINNARGKPSGQFGGVVTDRKAVRDEAQTRIAAINKANSDFWSARGGARRTVQ